MEEKRKLYQDMLSHHLLLVYNSLLQMKKNRANRGRMGKARRTVRDCYMRQLCSECAKKISSIIVCRHDPYRIPDAIKLQRMVKVSALVRITNCKTGLFGSMILYKTRKRSLKDKTTAIWEDVRTGLFLLIPNPK